VRVQDKVWVVTGAASGMGRELVLQLLQREARVARVDVSASGLDTTRTLARAGDRLSTHVVDLTDRPSVEALPDAGVEAHGVVDGVVYNAGIIQPFVPVAEMDYADIQRVLDPGCTSR
jgi:NAD(P)-dependent dehydrogenase (short-subunit alcohol dehydrogenase family)